MPELQPPELMPNGNVGTPTLVFLDFIQKCLLPKTLIKKLQLRFPSTSATRIYSNVNFEYDNDKSENSHLELKAEKNRPILYKNKSEIWKKSRNTKCEIGKCYVNPTSPSSKSETSTKFAHEMAQSETVLISKVSEKIDLPSESPPPPPSSTLPSSSTIGTQNINSKSLGDSSGKLLLLSSSTASPALLSNKHNCPSDPECFTTLTSSEKKTLSSREKKLIEKEERRRIKALMDEGIEERLIRNEKRYHVSAI